MKTVLRLLVCLLFTRQILALWWLFPRNRFFRNPLENRRWITTTDIRSGRSQSPIDLADFTEAYCPPINYTVNYNSTTQARILNTGHTVRVTVEGQRPTTLSGGPLTGQYVLQEVHFHWGTNDNQGSEHTINGFRYPMETHAVHYNSKYGSFQEAGKYKDGLSVIGIVFDILPYRNSDFKNYDNTMFTPLTSRLDSVPSENSTITYNAQDLLKWLWPFVSKDHYFTYTGSLTTSPFTEVVTWIVYDAVIPMSEQQIEEFRERLPEGNYRAIQPVNGRLIYFCDSQNRNIARF